MVLVNGGYLHCTDIKKFWEILLKRDEKKKMARVISKTQVSELGPSWPSCLLCSIYNFYSISTELGQNIYNHKILDEFDYRYNQIRMTGVICS